jgi:hypothetical protein
MTSLMVTFRTFSFLDFLADLLQKSISDASNLFSCCVFSVHVPMQMMLIFWEKTQIPYRRTQNLYYMLVRRVVWK